MNWGVSTESVLLYWDYHSHPFPFSCGVCRRHGVDSETYRVYTYACIDTYILECAHLWTDNRSLWHKLWFPRLLLWSILQDDCRHPFPKPRRCWWLPCFRCIFFGWALNCKSSVWQLDMISGFWKAIQLVSLVVPLPVLYSSWLTLTYLVLGMFLMPSFWELW